VNTDNDPGICLRTYQSERAELIAKRSRVLPEVLLCKRHYKEMESEEKLMYRLAVNMIQQNGISKRRC
jgi:hypothetical protein